MIEVAMFIVLGLPFYAIFTALNYGSIKQIEEDGDHLSDEMKILLCLSFVIGTIVILVVQYKQHLDKKL